MTIELNILSETVRDAQRVGTSTIPARLFRSVEVLGMTNSAGEPERYVARLMGYAANGVLRAEVDVERTGGKLSRLNNNRHAERVGRVLSAVKPMLDEYRAADAAVAKGENA